MQTNVFSSIMSTDAPVAMIILTITLSILTFIEGIFGDLESTHIYKYSLSLLLGLVH